MFNLAWGASPEELLAGKQRVKGAALAIREWAVLRGIPLRDANMAVAVLRGAEIADLAADHNLSAGRIRAIIAELVMHFELDREVGHFNL